MGSDQLHASSRCSTSASYAERFWLISKQLHVIFSSHSWQADVQHASREGVRCSLRSDTLCLLTVLSATPIWSQSNPASGTSPQRVEQSLCHGLDLLGWHVESMLCRITAKPDQGRHLPLPHAVWDYAAVGLLHNCDRWHRLPLRCQLSALVRSAPCGPQAPNAPQHLELLLPPWPRLP